MQKTIYLLTGPKGSGKSYTGTLFDHDFGIKFIRVEDWARTIKKDRSVDNETYIRDFFRIVEKGIRKELENRDSLCFESTGLSDYFDEMYDNLKKDFRVILIRMHADPQLCLQRVKTRDQSIHVNVSDNEVHMINKMVAEKEINADFEIVNNNIGQKALLEEIEKIIAFNQ